MEDDWDAYAEPAWDPCELPAERSAEPLEAPPNEPNDAFNIKFVIPPTKDEIIFEINSKK